MKLHPLQQGQIIEMTKTLAKQLKEARIAKSKELIEKAEKNLDGFISEIFKATEDLELKEKMENWKNIALISKL